MLPPLSQINECFTELDPNQQYYLHCKAGVRSMKPHHRNAGVRPLLFRAS